MNKYPIRVECKETENGQLEPNVIIWQDGRRFEVSRVLYHSISPTNEYEGIRFTIIVGNAEKYIYKVNHEWYVMA